MSIYALKPRFQALLRPGVAWLARAGVTANQVTWAAAVISVAIGALLCLPGIGPSWFALVPAWMLLRMAFNAVDGMLAREFNQASTLGAYLNELTDVVSDSALYLPFALVAPWGPWWVGTVIVLALLSEFAGVLGAAVGGTRRYDGPMGKSDRAVVFGALGLAVALVSPLPGWTLAVMPLISLALVWTIVQRVRRGVAARNGVLP
jgi:CDP-diacylglycerol--glycerol-3-phosphate 3-phosphatidyltransferase